jgi:acetyl esterase/lipase
MRRPRLAVPTFVLLASAAWGVEPPDEPEPTATEVYREVGGDSLHAYVFLPAGHGPGDRANTILLFHGGGWSFGAPVMTFASARRFAEWGLVAIAIEYRLSEGDVTPVEALDDACAAFAWARQQAAELGLSGRMAGYGVSAGGHLVAATATVGCGESSRGPDALLLWSPALDVVEDRWFVSRLQGRAEAEELSPASHVQRSTPPTSIVHGELDTLTPLAGVRRYCAALTELGQHCEVHVYPGVGHLLTRQLADQERDYDPDPEARADGITRQREFLTKLGFIEADPTR